MERLDFLKDFNVKFEENLGTLALCIALGLSVGILAAAPTCADLLHEDVKISQSDESEFIQFGEVKLQKVGDRYFPLPSER